MEAQCSARCRASFPRRALCCAAAACALTGAVMPAGQAAAQQVRVNRLNDLAFGTLAANGTSDARRTDNLCAYTGAASLGYRVTARGSGSSNAFTLANGGNTLAYTVQWASTPGATAGAAMTTGVPLAATTSATLNSQCLLGLGANATLIVTLPAANVAAARAGAYSGTLSITILPN